MRGKRTERIKWRTVPARDFCTSVRDGTHDSPKRKQDGRYLVTSRHIIGGRVDLSNAYRISQEDFDEVNRRSKVDEWDVLVSMIGTVGEPCLIAHKPNFAIKNIGLFKNKGEAEGKWLYYYLRSPQAQHLIREQSRGTTQAYIPLGALRDLPVPVPDSPDELRAIAHILGTLDDKIEVNRRMNETLEGMARALFKSWFVDFDPVLDNALAAGNPIPEEFRDRAAQRADAATSAASQGRPFGLPKPLAAQFPNAFHDSDLGPIPEGWEVGKIELCCERIQNGGTPKRTHPEFWAPPTISWLTSGELRQSIIVATENAISELGLKSSSAKWLPEGATVIALYGATAGQVALLAKRLTTNQAICGLVPRRNFRHFVYLAMSGLSSEMARQARGSAQQNISKQIVQNMVLAIPAEEAVAHFHEAVAPLFGRWIANLKNNESLAALRDTLLPKLLSGELRVADAERIAGRCV
jgi:type I restriction enzyme, S subunit